MSRRRIWTPEQDAILRSSTAAGIPIKVVATELELPTASIHRRRRELGLPRVPRVDCTDWAVHDEELLRLYRAGASIEAIAAAIGVGASSCYRRLQNLGEPARYPRRTGRNYKTPIVPYAEAHRLVYALLKECRRQHVGTRELADHVGVEPESIGNWNRGGWPSLKNLEAAGKLVDLRLVWQPLDGKVEQENGQTFSRGVVGSSGQAGNR